MTETIFVNATMLLPNETICGSLCLKDGRIADMGRDLGPRPGALAGAQIIDCQGDYLAPGLVELHTDNLERHIQPRPGVDWPHAQAILAHDAELAGAGITTVFDAMRVGSIPSGKSGDYAKYARALSQELGALRDLGLLRIHHRLHLRAEVCSETLIAELDEFTPEDQVGIVSLMDHTPGQRQFRDLSKLAQYVMGKRGMSSAEFDAHVARLTDLRARFGDQHEAAAVAVAARLGATLASHDDTTPEHVAVSKGYGIGLAEFPTTLAAAQACHDQGIAVMMGAPNLIRGGSHSGNIAARDLAEAGLLDIVSSDYVPAALLASGLVLGEIWGDMARGLAAVTAAPAQAVGLADRGRLVIGARADLIRFRRAGAAGALRLSPVLRGTWLGGTRVA